VYRAVLDLRRLVGIGLRKELQSTFYNGLAGSQGVKLRKT
jgi:hypothetical protein